MQVMHKTSFSATETEVNDAIKGNEKPILWLRINLAVEDAIHPRNDGVALVCCVCEGSMFKQYCLCSNSEWK